VNELSRVPSSFNGWDKNRIQSCVCDPGYFGSDCTLRYCPRGDDPMTECAASDSQTQELTLTMPLSLDAANAVTSGWSVAAADNSFAMVWKDNNGGSWTSAGVANPLSTTITAADVQAALKGLPNFVVDDQLDVTLSTYTTASATRTVTFAMKGDRNSGNLPTVKCPAQLGCPFNGCRPKYGQLRYSRSSVAGSAVAGNVAVISSNLIEPTANTHGVSIKVTVAAKTLGTRT